MFSKTVSLSSQPSELDVVPAIEEKKAFLHSLGIPVLDTLPGLE